jgi:hypothetical protein
MATATDLHAAPERLSRILPVGLRFLGATWAGFFAVLTISPLVGHTVAFALLWLPNRRALSEAPARRAAIG